VRAPRYDAEDLRESQARDQECLVLFEKHPHIDAYKYGGSFTPYAIVGVDKRFTDAELAAEYWFADSECQTAWIDGEHTDEMQGRFEYIERFASLPSYDD
jgi:hypothetical protein